MSISVIDIWCGFYYNLREMKETELKTEKEPKLKLKATWKEISRKQKGLMFPMIALLVLAAIFLVVSLVTLRPQGTVVIVGYGDVYGEMTRLSGGYRRDSWLNMLAFPILAVVFGVVHNVLALRVYRKYGKNMALLVVYATMLMIIGAFTVLLRLLGEW